MVHEIPMLNLVYELLFHDATFAISSEKSLNIVNLPHLLTYMSMIVGLPYVGYPSIDGLNKA